jgi:hypothetical protein
VKAKVDQADATSTYVAVDPGDDGLGQHDNRPQQTEHPARSTAGGLSRGGQVGAGAKSPAGVGQHDRAYAVVFRRGREVILQLAHQLLRQRVAVVRRVQAYRGDGAVDPVMHEFVRHGTP